MFTRNYLIIFLLFIMTGCASAPKFKYVKRHDPIMDQNGGVVLLVDVCNQIDVVGDDDYYVIKESKEVASALAKEIAAYLEKNGVSVKTEILPFVCGAFDNPQNKPAKVADEVGGKVNELSKPYCVTGNISKDDEYLKALTTLSTYTFERCMTKYLEDSARNQKKLDKFKAPAMIVQEDQFREAANVIKAKTNASSVLYVGLKGRKLSGGKKFGQGLFRFTVGMATGIATAGLGTGYAVSFIPGGNIDWRYETAGLIDLESQKLSWKSWTTGGGNPLKIKTVANPKEEERLLKDLVFDKEPITGKK